jgi:hypothetical protein
MFELVMNQARLNTKRNRAPATFSIQPENAAAAWQSARAIDFSLAEDTAPSISSWSGSSATEILINI